MDIREKPFTTPALTIRELKAILAVLPEVNENGEECEVWVSHKDGTSNNIHSVWALDKRKNSCDVLLDPHR